MHIQTPVNMLKRGEDEKELNRGAMSYLVQMIYYNPSPTKGAIPSFNRHFIWTHRSLGSCQIIYRTQTWLVNSIELDTQASTSPLKKG